MPFDWKNGWIPIVCTGLMSFLLGVVWAHTPFSTWCSTGTESGVQCTREWLTVISTFSGGLLTLIAALIVVKPALTQLKIQTIEPLIRMRSELTNTINAINSTNVFVRQAQSDGDDLITSWRNRPTDIPPEARPRKVGTILDSIDQDRVRNIQICANGVISALHPMLQVEYLDDEISRRASKCIAAAEYIKHLVGDMENTNPYFNADPQQWIDNTTHLLERELTKLGQNLSDFLGDRLHRRDVVLRRLAKAYEVAETI